MMDLPQIAAGLGTIKTAFDTAKAALGIVRDIRDALPNSSDKQRIGTALDHATEKLAESEGIIAAALGYTLCRCQYPPTPMLLVGFIPFQQLKGMDKGVAMQQQPRPGLTGGIPVHQCPKCKSTDAPGYPNFQRTVAPESA